MYASVRALLNQIIDYAGLFPPAKLPLEEALRNYLHAKKTSPYAWMLGRFVCPTGRLSELLALAKEQPNAALLSVAALGNPVPQPDRFTMSVEADLRLIDEFRKGWGQGDVIDSYEVALAKNSDPTNAAEHLLPLSSRLQDQRLCGFLEVPLAPSWRDDIRKATLLLHQLRYAPNHARLGMKLRCGGITTETFPSDEQISFFIGECWAWRLPWKATAGLHHPRRHWDANLHVWHHGFLNLFVAGILAQTHSFKADAEAILADRDGQHFHFENDSIAWKNWRCTTAQITEARAEFTTSFGSCSFDEPCADLLAMGLLDAAG